MLTCGLLRTNFSFDTACLLESCASGARRGGGCDQVVPELLRDFSVVVELHGVRRTTSGPVAQVSGVAEHRGHRDKTGDGLYTRSGGNASDFPPSGMQIAQHLSDVLVGSYHLQGHDRLEDGGGGLVGSLDERPGPGNLEGVMV